MMLATVLELPMLPTLRLALPELVVAAVVAVVAVVVVVRLPLPLPAVAEVASLEASLVWEWRCLPLWRSSSSSAALEPALMSMARMCLAGM